MKSLNRFLLLFALLFAFSTCQQNESSIEPEFHEIIRKTDLNNNSELSNLINELPTNVSSGRAEGTQFFNTSIGTLDLNQIIETYTDPDRPASNYTIKLLTDEDQSLKLNYLVLVSEQDQYYAYIMQFEPNRTNHEKISLFENYSGSIRILDLEWNEKSIEYFENGQQLENDDSSGRTAATFTNCECKYAFKFTHATESGGENGLGTMYFAIEGINCDCQEGGGDVDYTNLGDNEGIGTPVFGSDSEENSSGGSIGGGTNNGGGGTGETIGFGDLEECTGTNQTYNSNGDCIDCPFGVNSNNACMSEEEARIAELETVLEQDPDLLINIPCEDLPKWQAVSSIPIPISVEERLDFLESQTGGLADLLSLNDDWELQELKDGNGTAVNMDEFSVNVSLPNSVSPESILEHIRTNLLDDLHKAVFQPHPSLSGETGKWNNQSTSLGSILSIDIDVNDSSVICIQKSSRSWTFTTIEDPFNYAHPVSGNRQFGFDTNSDGSYTFYTRGVDRMTNFVEAMGRDVIKFATDIDILDEANDTWISFQSLIANHVNSIGGSAEINTPITHRPDYDKLASFLSGEISVSELKNCD